MVIICQELGLTHQIVYESAGKRACENITETTS